MKKILLTGAAGGLGRVMRTRLRALAPLRPAGAGVAWAWAITASSTPKVQDSDARA